MKNAKSIFNTCFLVILIQFLPATFNDAASQEAQILRPAAPPLPVPIAPGTVVDINPETGILTLTTTEQFSCQQDNSTCDISIADPDGYFQVNGTSGTVEAVESSTINMTWNARGAWSCTGTGDLTGTIWNTSEKLPSGSENVSLGTLAPGIYSVGLRCENGPTSVDANDITLEITESSISVPLGCEGRQPPGTFVTGSQCIFNSTTADCSSYNSIFGTFPGVPSGVEFITPNNTFVALEFNTADLTATGGTWDFVVPQFGTRNTGKRLISISNCPGDFDQGKIETEMGAGCYQASAPFFGDLSWYREGTSGTGCRLEVREQPYYLNIIYTTDPEGTLPSELSWDCGGSTTASACMNNLAPKIN